MEAAYPTPQKGAPTRSLTMPPRYELMTTGQLMKRAAKLEKKMLKHARDLEFEEAARLRDEIQRFEISGLACRTRKPADRSCRKQGLQYLTAPFDPGTVLRSDRAISSGALERGHRDTGIGRLAQGHSSEGSTVSDWAISSGVERHVDIVEVGGSRPPSPTNSETASSGVCKSTCPCDKSA